MNNLSKAQVIIRQHAEKLSAAGDLFSINDSDGEQVIQCHKASVALYRLTSERRHPDLLFPLSRLVGWYVRFGYYTQAEDTFMEIIGIASAADPDDRRLPFWLEGLAQIRGAQGKVSLGLQAANEALVFNQRHYGRVSRQVSDTMRILGDLHSKQGALEEAERCFLFARDVYSGTLRADAPELMITLERIRAVEAMKSKSGTN